MPKPYAPDEDELPTGLIRAAAAAPPPAAAAAPPPAAESGKRPRRPKPATLVDFPVDPLVADDPATAATAAIDVEPVGRFQPVDPVPVARAPVAPDPARAPVARAPAARAPVAADVGDATVHAEPVRTAAAAAAPRADDLLKARLLSGTGARVGRFTVLRHLDEGGMGLIFAARDEELDRQVALKILRANLADGSIGRARLIREAQALAKLSHPNVVTVYEVGEFEGHVFVAMELIEGRTLRGWLKVKPRRWREIVQVYVQAGRGLAAAHAAGIIHRDFKPSNVLVGHDGRVRVLDFGLALAPGQSTGERAPTITGASSVISSSTGSRHLGDALTMAGAIAGTPPYMAPEQLRGGGDVDARADLFAFCVALAEALYGERPFKAKTLDDRRREAVERPYAELPRGAGVPAFLRAALLRGLHPDPDRRFQSMGELLAAIDRDPARTLRRAAAAVGLGALLLVVGFMVARRGSAACAGVDDEIAAAWGDDRRDALRAAITGTGLAFAEGTWERLGPGLDGYAAEWRGARVGACEAHQRGEHAADLYGRQVACLQRRQSALKALVDTLSAADAAAVEAAIQAVGDLPAIAICGDVAALTAAVPPPDDPAIAGEVDQLRGQLDLARADLSLKKTNEGLAYALPVLARAGALAYVPLRAEAAALVGNLYSVAGDYPTAEEHLTEALWLADQVRDDALLAHAMASLITVIGDKRGRHEEALRWRRHADAVRARLPAEHRGQARLLAAIGTVLYRRALVDESIDHLQRALAIVEALYGAADHRITEALVGLGNAHMTRGDAAAARPLYERALAIDEAAFGPDHPRVANDLLNLTAVVGMSGDLDGALAHAQRALAIEEAALGPDHPDLAPILGNLAVSYAMKRDLAAARPYFERSLAIEERALGGEHPAIAVTRDNLGTLTAELGDLVASRAHYERALAIREAALLRDDPHLAITLLGLARLDLREAKAKAALARIERAQALREARPDVVSAAELAEARFLHAVALRELGRDPARQRELAEQALAGYRQADAERHQATIAEIEAWLVESPASAVEGSKKKKKKKKAKPKKKKK